MEKIDFIHKHHYKSKNKFFRIDIHRKIKFLEQTLNFGS